MRKAARRRGKEAETAVSDRPITVLIIDDHEMVRIGLAAVLNTEEDSEVVGEAENGESGLRLAREYKPNVVLMDLVTEGMDGVETTRRIMEALPDCRIIVLTSYLDRSEEHTTE